MIKKGKKHIQKTKVPKHSNMADGTAYAFSRWLIIISYWVRSEVHHWVLLIHNMLDLLHIFASPRSISLHMLGEVTELMQNITETIV